MPGLKRVLPGAVACAAILGLGACSGNDAETKAAAARAGAECVPMEIGNYHWDGSGFTVIGASDAPVRPAPPSDTSWLGELQYTFAMVGYSWMGVQVRDHVATLTGIAPDAETKARALQSGKEIIGEDPVGRDLITLVVDGISVEGGEAGVGESLAQLSQGAITLQSCQKAFSGTLNGRNIEFTQNSAAIEPASAALLDAVTGVAALCRDFKIEIGGHTDSRGSPDINLDLSQQRANAVRDYLIEKGVDGTWLVAAGYGESMPLDRSETEEARARNRRTEFKVLPRP